MQTAEQRAQVIFTERGGILRATEAIRLGIAPRMLYAMRDAKKLRTLSRGVYQLASMAMPAQPELVVIARRLQKAVICLVSALYFHGLTTQVPHYVYAALPVGSPQPKLDYPSLYIVRLSGECMTSGIESHRIDGESIRVFSVAKTIADCFKFRNKIGIDVAVEALRDALQSGKTTPGQLHEFARINRVTNILRPYLEALQ
jgi:predicted transcriptional regulator of viral defense system